MIIQYNHDYLEFLDFETIYMYPPFLYEWLYLYQVTTGSDPTHNNNQNRMRQNESNSIPNSPT